MNSLPILRSKDVEALADMVQEETLDLALGSWVVEGADDDPLDYRIMGDILWGE